MTPALGTAAKMGRAIRKNRFNSGMELPVPFRYAAKAASDGASTVAVKPG